jgi:flagella basal body P-ring formation protein FlgA
MIRIAVTAALLIATLGHARSEPAPAPVPKLKELVAVTGDLVRIGDMIDDAGAAANIAVFRAPDLGQTGTVQVSRVLEAVRAHDMAMVDTAGLSELIVTRLSRVISPKQIQEQITQAVAGKYGFGDARNLLVTLDRDLRTMHVEASAAGDLAITRLHADPRTGRFDVAFELPGSAAARRMPLRFTGTVTEAVEAATLTRSLARGEIVRSADVVMDRRPKSEVGAEALSFDQVVGLATKRSLRVGQPLRSSDLMKPEVVQRNEAVTIVYEVPGILLTVRGKALETGAVGDLIGVHNVQTNRTVQASIAGPGRVTIAATRPLVAAAVASRNTAQARAE